MKSRKGWRPSLAAQVNTVMQILQKGLRSALFRAGTGRSGHNSRMDLPLISLLFVALAFLVSGEAAASVFWQTKDMLHCGGDLRAGVVYDGSKSTVAVPGDGQVHGLLHCIRFCDFEKAEFVLEFGEVSPHVKWELGAALLDKGGEWRSLLKGQGGGTHRAPMSPIPRYTGADVHLRVKSDQPGKMEILRWAVETPAPARFAKEHVEASKALAGATPLERGHIPHWNPTIGGFVCACNPTHPEHYNFWLEDEGEQLWSFGNYPRMMKLYGKPLRDFIVKHCKAGFPVRRVNDQPLAANPFLTGGEYRIDTGLIVASGNLARDPHLNVHHAIYETGGLLYSIEGFNITYKSADGSSRSIDFARPTASVAYDTPRKDNARLTMEASDDAVSARFTINVFRGRVTIEASARNKGGGKVSDITAGFALRNCENYFKHAPNKIRRLGDVTLIYSEQPTLEECNNIRLAGPGARAVETQEEGGKIKRATVSAPLSPELATGAEAAGKLVDINAGSTSYAENIDLYKGVDFADADISLSFVPTYALLGLATYCHRFPEDKEAREVADRMIENFLKTRTRLNCRDLAYLLWVLDLFGRQKDVDEVAYLIEQRSEQKDELGALDGGAMGIGLRRAGRWDAADRITAKIKEVWDFGVVPACEFLGSGSLQSKACAEKAYKQLSYNLRTMYWDAPDKITTHTNREVEEGPAETQAYTLIALDLLSRQYGGITPLRLDWSAKTEITKLSFDAKTSEWRMSLIKTADFDVFTNFRKPTRVLWNGKELEDGKWRYSQDTGVVYITGVKGDGELTLVVEGEAPKDDPAWKPIDYLGLGKR
ncbi:MAG: hypothetical protein Q7T82_17700 [Armatimonadota bacterium]|nr:hypothetical protein [Armatimonadota bacterium]